MRFSPGCQCCGINSPEACGCETFPDAWELLVAFPPGDLELLDPPEAIGSPANTAFWSFEGSPRWTLGCDGTHWILLQWSGGVPDIGWRHPVDTFDCNGENLMDCYLNCGLNPDITIGPAS